MHNVFLTRVSAAPRRRSRQRTSGTCPRQQGCATHAPHGPHPLDGNCPGQARSKAAPRTAAGSGTQPRQRSQGQGIPPTKACSHHGGGHAHNDRPTMAGMQGVHARKQGETRALTVILPWVARTEVTILTPSKLSTLAPAAARAATGWWTSDLSGIMRPRCRDTLSLSSTGLAQCDVNNTNLSSQPNTHRTQGAWGHEPEARETCQWW